MIKYIREWFRDTLNIFYSELKTLITDEGVMVIVIVAGLLYPILYNMIYQKGILEETPIAVVDDADCSESRDFIKEMDACREVRIAYRCVNMEEAKKLFQERKVNGIVYFSEDFGKKLAAMETSIISVYTDLSSFLYYKNLLLAADFVMLHNIGKIQIQRYSQLGMTGQEARQLVKPVLYEENNPYNATFSYSVFLISAILLLIVQQVMLYSMSICVGTMREEKRSFCSLVDTYGGKGVGRVILGRGLTYWLLFMIIGLYIATIVPAMFDFPQRGQFSDIFILLLCFVTDCVFFSMVWSSLITKRESVFLLMLFISPICLFLTGFSWPTTSFPVFWKYFSYIFPSTFACRGFINLNTAGGDLSTIHFQLRGISFQTIGYFILSIVLLYHEHYRLKHKSKLSVAREKITDMIVAGQIKFDKKVDEDIAHLKEIVKSGAKSRQ